MMSVCSRDDIAMGTEAKEGAHLKGTIQGVRICVAECQKIHASPPALNVDGNEESEAGIAEFLQAVKKDFKRVI